MTNPAKARGETTAQRIQESSMDDLRRRAIQQEQFGNYWALKTRLLIDEIGQLARQNKELEQALWDIYGILGFDQDGSQIPPLTEPSLPDLVRDAAREFREDYDQTLENIGEMTF